MINDFAENIDLSFLDKHCKANNRTGGRPNFSYRSLLKIYLYALYENISIRGLEKFHALGSDLHYLSQGLPNFPDATTFTKFLNILDIYIDIVFSLSIGYTSRHIELDFANLYCDGTVFEAHNNRHKIITDKNIERSNKKWNAVLDCESSGEEMRTLAQEKISLNKDRTLKLNEYERTSYGRTDNDSVILKDKNGSFIAGFNVQFVEESRHGLIVFPYISNKNPDSAAFLDMAPTLLKTYRVKTLTMDTGYGTPEILSMLVTNGILPVIKALKNENANKKITDHSFDLSENDDCLICPKGQLLERVETKIEGMTAFKASNCQYCDIKTECLDGSKNKRVTINVEEFKVFKIADAVVNGMEGKEMYSHRGNKCESPNGFIKYNLNGKKLKRVGLVKNNTTIKLYSILFNLRRLVSIKSAVNKGGSVD
jgi:transposase